MGFPAYLSPYNRDSIAVGIVGYCKGNMRAGRKPVLPESDEGALIAGRYQLLRPLARGGMGEVFLAKDMATASLVALKQVRNEHLGRPKMLAYFRSEYHVLARLKHPRIIEVFEFGMHDGAPFYTMELLDGEDLRDVGPVPYKEGCRYLRDVASSLALLHAQRLLHRDLSPRNVRRTADGRCKLLDFGAMTPFGVPPVVAGTAPFVPPEAADGGFLDQRADLYSLGALAYWLLSGEHAYPATKLDELPALWPKPIENLRSRVPEIPPELDALVMSLLEVDLLKRPNHVAEVIERLNAIAQLEPESSVEEAQSFLSSAVLHGRQKDLRRLRGVIERGVRGDGSGILVEGPSGIGKTRLSNEVAVIAQTLGFLTLRGVGVHAQNQATLTQQLWRALERAAPDLAAASRKVVPPPSSELEIPLDPSRPPAFQDNLRGFEERARQQERLGEEFARVAKAQPLCVLVDDLDLADEFSAAFIAGIAHQARALGVLVVASVNSERTPVAQAAIGDFRRSAGLFRLAPLDAAAVRAMVSGVLGEVPNLDRVIDWLDRGARGNPGLMMALIQHLVQRRQVRYVDGTWVLPEGEIAERLPEGLANTLALRLTTLRSEAQALAEVVAVFGRDVPLDLCLSVSSLPNDETFSALNELVAAGVLVSAAGGVAFAQGALRDAVHQRVDAQRLRDIHGRIARVLLALPQTLERRFEAGVHLVQTEDELRGADLLAEVGPQLMHKGRALGDAIPAMEKALEVYERHKIPQRKSLLLRQVLVLSGYLFDYRLALKYGEATLERLAYLAGLPWVQRLRRFVGVNLAYLLAFTIALVRYPLLSKTRGAPGPYASLVLFGRSIMGVVGVRATSLDAAGARRATVQVRPVAGLGFTGIVPVHLACEAFTLQPQGREADLRAAIEMALASLQGHLRLGMSEPERLDLRVGLRLSGSINECYRIGSRALEMADELEALGTRLAQASAHRVRMTYHVVRGDRERTEHFRRLIDLYGIQVGTTWQIEWFAAPIEGLASLRFGDLVAAKRALARLEELAQELPSLAPLRDMVRIGYHARRGEYEGAVELGERFLAQVKPRTVIGWGNAYADIAGAYNGLGQHARALEICEAALSVRTAEDRDYVVMYGTLEFERLVALAGLGRVAETRAQLAELRTWLVQESEYALCVLLLEGQVRAAALLEDRHWLRSAIQEMRDMAERTTCVSLIAHAARVAQVFVRRARTSFPPPNGEVDVLEGLEDGDSAATFMEGAANPRARLRGLLSELCVMAGAECASIYVEGTSEIEAIWGDTEIPSEVREAAQACLEAKSSMAAANVLAQSGANPLLSAVHARGYVLQILPQTQEAPRAVLILRRPISPMSEYETLFTELTGALAEPTALLLVD